MIRTSAQLCLCIGLFVGMTAAQTDPERDDIAALRQFKLVDLPNAYAAQDTAALRTMLAERYERIGFDGERTNRETEIARAAENKPAHDSFTFAIDRLDVFENGTAIVSGVGTVHGKDSDGAYVLTYASSNTFLKFRGSWKLVASHVSGRKVSRPG